MAEDKIVKVKGLAQAFLNTPVEEEPEKPIRSVGKKSRRSMASHTPKASAVAATMRKKQQEDDKQDKTAEVKAEKKVAPVITIAPVVHRINMTEDGHMKKVPACKKAVPLKKPEDATLIIAEKRKASSKKIAVPCEVAKKEKPEVKVVEAKANTKVEETKKAVAKKETAKPVAKKAAAKPVAKKEAAKPVAKKEAAKPVAKKEAVKSATTKQNVVIEFAGRSYNENELVKKAEEIWAANNKASALKDMKLYIKPEDGKVYYVFNDSVNGDFDL